MMQKKILDRDVHALFGMCANVKALAYVKKTPQVLVIALAPNHLPSIPVGRIFHTAVNLQNLSLQCLYILNGAKNDILLGRSWLSLSRAEGVGIRLGSYIPSIPQLARRDCESQRLFPYLNNLFTVNILT